VFTEVIKPQKVSLCQAVDLLQERFNPVAIFLYGSYARHNIHSESDIDLAIFQPNIRPEIFTLSLARVDLEALCKRPVDLVILEEVSPILAMEIFRNHQLLVLQDRRPLDAFFVKTLTDYADLKIVRRPIEQALLTP
jgi:predicted nucleotidyltransferase